MGRRPVNEFIDQWKSSKRIINDSLNIDKANQRQVRADSVARRLVDKFTAPDSYRFFYKAAYYLSEEEIWRYYENAHKGRIGSPIRYFVACCKKRIDQLS